MTFKVCYLGYPDKPMEWEIASSQRYKATWDLVESAWRFFLDRANCCQIFGDNIALYRDQEVLAYTFEHPQYKDPDWDEFDRYRIRVTGAMPPAFRAKIISEMKSGVRHMRDF
jgi:hypothetical protein